MKDGDAIEPADKLSEALVFTDAIEQFRRWFDDALRSDMAEPTAMTLATATAKGVPSARVVLLKEIDDDSGFVFYTNYESRKGRELAANPRAALVFYWEVLRRQVRVEGQASPLSPDASRRYFQTRPRPSQLNAVASRQSQVIASRQVLKDQVQQVTRQFENRPVPLPQNWGGYRVEAQTIEFWQGRSNRLHDRLRYTRMDDGAWKIERLAP